MAPSTPPFRPMAPGFYTPTPSFRAIAQHYAVMDAENQTVIAIVGRVEDEPEAIAETIQYQHLFIAAPDMLDLLKTIENDGQQVPEWLWRRIQEVVAKAEGRAA